MNTLLAFISGEALLHELGYLLVFILAALVLWWLGKYLFGIMGAPAMVLTIWTALFVAVGCIMLINFLLSLGGHPFIVWGRGSL